MGILNRLFFFLFLGSRSFFSLCFFLFFSGWGVIGLCIRLSIFLGSSRLFSSRRVILFVFLFLCSCGLLSLSLGFSLLLGGSLSLFFVTVISMDRWLRIRVHCDLVFLLYIRSSLLLSWLFNNLGLWSLNDFFLNLSGNLCGHGTSHLSCLLKSVCFLADLKIFLCNLIGVFTLKIYTDFIVDKTNDHTVMERDQRGWLMISHLLLVLHEDEGTVGRRFILSRFGDEPTLGIIIGNIAVIGRDSL